MLLSRLVFPRPVRRVELVLRIGATLAVAALGLDCAGCATVGWSQSFGRLLIVLGTVAMLVGLGLEALAARSPTMADLSDLWTLLIGIAGLSLGVISSATGVKPCVLCLVFWAFNSLSVVLLIGGSRPLARQAALGVLLTSFCAVALAIHRPSSRLIASFVPPMPEEEAGPVVGTGIAPDLRFPRDGIVAISTGCIPCVRRTLVSAVARLTGEGYKVTLAAPYEDFAAQREMPRLPLIEFPASSLPRMRLALKGAPRIIQIRDGRIVRSASPSAFRPLQGFLP